MHFQTRNKYKVIHKNVNFNIDRIILQNILIASMLIFAKKRILFRKRIPGTLLLIVPQTFIERLSNLTVSLFESR